MIVGRERIIKDRQSVEMLWCHRLGHTRAECHINPWPDQHRNFGEPYGRPARGVIKKRRGGTNIEFKLRKNSLAMVDTGATYTCLNPPK